MSELLRVTVARGQTVVDLTEYLVDPNAFGTHLVGGTTGTGLPTIDAKWFHGAGDGAVWRGARVLPRVMGLPLLVEGTGRGEIAARLRDLALVLTPSQPDEAGAVLSLVEPDGTTWQTQVERTGGGDLTWGESTDSTTWATTELELTAPDPFFTRVDPSSFLVTVAVGGRSLLPRLSLLRVAGSATTGQRTVENPGDAPAFPIWTVTGPGYNFTAINAAGQTLRWEGTLAAGETLTLDTRDGTVTDSHGVNRYSDLAPAPRFWAVPPGRSQAWVTMEGTIPGVSTMVCRWRPRRWLVF